MPQPKLKVELKKFHDEAIVPEYKSDMAAAFDLHACFPSDVISYTIQHGEFRVVETGIGIFLNNPDYCLEIWERSGFGCKGIARRAGLVDPDFQGQIGVVVHNLSGKPLTILRGDRVAQAKIAPVQRVQFEVVEEFSAVTGRGSGAWGSTGV